MNFFFLAILLKPVANPNEQIWTPTPVIQLLPLAAYYLFVLSAPFFAGANVFVGIVVMIRFLLFCPFILPAVVPEGGGKSYLTPRKASWADAGPFQFIGVCSALLWLMHTFITLKDNGVHFGKIFSAVNEDYAVSALGYDYILSLVSLGVWALQVGNDVA